MPSSLRTGSRPCMASLTAASSASAFIVPEQTKPPGMASTSTPNAADLRTAAGTSSGTSGLILTIASPTLRCTLRARTTTPCWFSARSGVSKKATCRSWASSGSIPRRTRADRRLASGTLNFSSTLSAPLSSPRTSAICSIDKRLSEGPAVGDRLGLLGCAGHCCLLSPSFCSRTVRAINRTVMPIRVGLHHPVEGGSDGNYPTWGGLRPPGTFVGSC